MARQDAGDDTEDILDLRLVVGGKPETGPHAADAPDALEAAEWETPAEQIKNELASTVIGEDMEISGNLVSPREIFVAGKIKGDVTCRRLIADNSSRIQGGVVADEVIVDGHIAGPIRALRVTLKANARVEGQIFYQSFAMEKGADFEGLARRSDNPKQFEIGASGTPGTAHAGPQMPTYQAVRPAPSGYRPAPKPATPALKQAS